MFLFVVLFIFLMGFLTYLVFNNLRGKIDRFRQLTKDVDDETLKCRHYLIAGPFLIILSEIFLLATKFLVIDPKEFPPFLSWIANHIFHQITFLFFFINGCWMGIRGLIISKRLKNREAEQNSQH